MAPEKSTSPQETSEPSVTDAVGAQPAQQLNSQEPVAEAQAAVEAAPASVETPAVEAAQAAAEAPMDGVEQVAAETSLPTDSDSVVSQAPFASSSIPESPLVSPASASDADAAAAAAAGSGYAPPVGTTEQPYGQQPYGQQPYGQQTYAQQPQSQAQMAPAPKDRVVAGILGILLGSLGIHKFYLGYTTEGVIALVITIIGSCLFGLGPIVMAIIGIVEGCIYLFKSPEEFYNTYVYNKRGWF